MSDKLQEALIKYLNREAVATQSPGLPGFGGYPGNRSKQAFNPNGVALFTTLPDEISGLS